MASESKSPPAAPRRAADGARTRPAPRRGFHKDRATLWLLTLSVGLGLGAAARFVQRADQGQPVNAAAPRFSGAQPQANSGVPFQSQRVAVLPQRSYGARATTRMS